MVENGVAPLLDIAQGATRLNLVVKDASGLGQEIPLPVGQKPIPVLTTRSDAAVFRIAVESEQQLFQG